MLCVSYDNKSKYFNKYKTCFKRVCTLHFNRSGRGRGPQVVGCDAGINPTVLGHQITDLQGDLPGVTRDTERMPSDSSNETIDG